MAIDEVVRLRSQAEQAIACLNEERLPDDEAVQRAAERVRQKATDLIRQAKDPIRLGVVGEFSVGKSMLIGTLLGKPDLLPVEERAATGNVTALYLTPGEPGRPTAFTGDPVVHLLSRPELADCVGYVVDELVKKVRESMPKADPESLSGYNPVEQGWDRIEQWCRANLWPSGGPIGGLEPRKIALELLQIRDAHLSAEAVLGGHAPVPQQKIRAALDLGSTLGVPDSYPQRRVQPGLTVADLTTEESLSRCFPLIRWVSYTVAVDPDCWPLDGLRDQTGVVLLDFPGLTASRSARRDEFLSRSELRTVHTIVTVFGSAKPGNDIPHRFYGMLESHGRDPGELRDSIIAVGNAFDVLSVPELPGETPLTLESVRSASQRFADLSHNASDLIQHRDDRIRLVSSVVAMQRYGYKTDFGAQEEQHLTRAKAEAAGKTEGWSAIGARMRAGEPDSPWAEAVLAFAEDGGMRSLRWLIEDHAQKHGLANKIASLGREQLLLRGEVERLVILLPPEEIAEGTAERGQLLLEQLFDEFRLQHAELMRAAKQFGEPTQVRRGGTGIIELARDRAVRHVVGWADWRHIVQGVEQGLIPKRAKSDDLDEDNPFAEFGDVSTGTEDDTTEPFFEQYRTAVRDTVAVAREDLQAAVRLWADHHGDALAGLRADLREPQRAELLEIGLDRLRAASGKDNNRLGALKRLADLEWAVSRIKVQLDKAGPVSEDEIAATFPLRRHAVLPWHALANEDPSEPDQRYVRHQTYLMRLRREVAAAVADTVGQRIAGDIAQFRRNLVNALVQARGYIPTPEQVRVMFPPQQAGTDGAQESAVGSPMRSLLREWRAQDAEPGL